MSEFAFHLGKIDNWSLVVKALHGNPKKYQATPYSHVTHFEDMATKDQGKIVNYHILDSRRKIVYRILQRVLLIWKRKLLSTYQPSCAVGNSKELADWLLTPGTIRSSYDKGRTEGSSQFPKPLLSKSLKETNSNVHQFFYLTVGRWRGWQSAWLSNIRVFCFDNFSSM